MIARIIISRGGQVLRRGCFSSQERPPDSPVVHAQVVHAQKWLCPLIAECWKRKRWQVCLRMKDSMRAAACAVDMRTRAGCIPRGRCVHSECMVPQRGLVDLGVSCSFVRKSLQLSFTLSNKPSENIGCCFNGHLSLHDQRASWKQVSSLLRVLWWIKELQFYFFLNISCKFTDLNLLQVRWSGARGLWGFCSSYWKLRVSMTTAAKLTSEPTTETRKFEFWCELPCTSQSAWSPFAGKYCEQPPS